MINAIVFVQTAKSAGLGVITIEKFFKVGSISREINS
jgi:hypothetical protein